MRNYEEIADRVFQRAERYENEKIKQKAAVKRSGIPIAVCIAAVGAATGWLMYTKPFARVNTDDKTDRTGSFSADNSEYAIAGGSTDAGGDLDGDPEGYSVGADTETGDENTSGGYAQYDPETDIVTEYDADGNVIRSYYNEAPHDQNPDTDDYEEDIAAEYDWNGLEPYEQYTGLELYGNVYTTRCAAAADDSIKGLMESGMVLHGYDYTDDKEYSTAADVYAIEGISHACAVAVKFAQSEGYYIYINTGYSPETLGQLIDDLSLRDNMSFGRIYIEDYTDPDNIFTEEYSEIDSSDIWDMLLDDPTAPSLPDYDDREKYDGIIDYSYKTRLDISIDIPILGYENIAMWTDENGYLQTNILDTGKYFCIGEEKAENFKNYVRENYTGTTETCSAAEEDGDILE